jgi:foldase protein PrsA
MKFRYIAKKLGLLALIGMLCFGGLTGCGKNTKIVFTTGLSGNQLFKIGSTTCTTPEIMVYLTSFYNQYVDTYGQEMWQHDFGGVSLENHVKDIVLSKMAQIKIMNLMAQERRITLDAKEKDKISEAAKVYYSLLSDELKETEKITMDVVENVFEEYTLANKVYTSITNASDIEISDDEARTVAVELIYFRNWKYKNKEKVALNDSEKMKVLRTAKEVLSKINNGEDFATLATQYSEDKQVLKNYARGRVEPEFEELLFSMDKGELSDIKEFSDGYYIIKCVSTMDYEATQKNKIVLAERRMQEAFGEAYTEIASNTHSQFRDKKWDTITLNEEIHRTEANFFDIYQEYIKQ